MSYTADVPCSSSDWSVLITGQDSGFAQLKDDGPVLVHVAQAKPAADSIEGIVLVTGELEELSFSGLEEGDVVYGRSLVAGDPTLICVIAPGTAP